MCFVKTLTHSRSAGIICHKGLDVWMTSQKSHPLFRNTLPLTVPSYLQVPPARPPETTGPPGFMLHCRCWSCALGFCGPSLQGVWTLLHYPKQRGHLKASLWPFHGCKLFHNFSHFKMFHSADNTHVTSTAFQTRVSYLPPTFFLLLSILVQLGFLFKLQH